MSGKRKKNQSTVSRSIPKMLLQKVVTIYVFLILSIYPLYYQDKYFNMGDAKWHFFKWVTLICASMAGLFFLWYVIEQGGKGNLASWFSKEKISTIDWFVIAYLAVNLISTLITPYRKYVIWGFKGWYMGLVAQICFVLLYFTMSRFWRWDGPVLVLALGTASIVFLLGILMRFRIDPMEMYIGLKEYYIENFLSTLGQATWYSSYMCIIFPLGMFAFWYYDHKTVRILAGIFTSLSFMTFCTQNSDSAYMSLFAIFMMLFWISVESNKRFDRFLQVVIVCLASFKFMGLLRIAFPDAAVPLETISDFMGKSILTWVLLALAAAMLFGFRRMADRGFDISEWKNIRIFVLASVISAIVLMALYIYLNSTGVLPIWCQSSNNYLLFDNDWGNGRGINWRAAFMTFVKDDIFHKILGYGPETFREHVYVFYGEELRAYWGDRSLTCAHNEWLNALVNLGLLGFVSYVGIFVSGIKRFLANSEKYPEGIAVAISICAYMSHNFFCYQQIICTPVIFILMGCAEALIRRGYSRED